MKKMSETVNSFEDTIQNFCLRSFKKSNILAILLYGSYAESRADQYSDVDLICLTESPPTRRITKRHMGKTLEIQFLTPANVEEEISPKVWQNNVVLHAFQTGRWIYDSGGKFHELQDRVNLRWIAGLGKLERRDALQMRQALGRLSGAVELLLYRSQSGKLGLRLAELRLDRLMMNILFSALRAQGLWAFPPWVLGRLGDKRYSEMQIFCQQYLEAEALVSRCQLVASLAERGDAMWASHIGPDPANGEGL